MTDEKGLKVAFVEDRLTISIDVPTLCHALEYGLKERMGTSGGIVDRAVFLRAFVDQLQHEEEDGTTPVHRMLDQAADDMVENGAEGWRDENDDE